MITELLARELAERATPDELAASLASLGSGADGDAPEALAALVARYLNGVPGALDALIAMTRSPQYGRSAAFVTGQALVYLVDADDLFRDEELGALGLLDDAYLVHACAAALRATFPGLETAYAPPDEHAAAAVRSLLPAGVPEALDRTCENLVRVAAALYAGSGTLTATGERPEAALRVDDALALVAGGRVA